MNRNRLTFAGPTSLGGLARTKNYKNVMITQTADASH